MPKQVVFKENILRDAEAIPARVQRRTQFDGRGFALFQSLEFKFQVIHPANVLSTQAVFVLGPQPLEFFHGRWVKKKQSGKATGGAEMSYLLGMISWPLWSYI